MRLRLPLADIGTPRHPPAAPPIADLIDATTSFAIEWLVRDRERLGNAFVRVPLMDDERPSK